MTKTPSPAPPSAPRQPEIWSRAVVVVPWLLALVTAAVGIFQFTVTQAQANRRPFLEAQLSLTQQAVDATAVLATTDDPTAWKEARRTFWRLHYGKLAVVEDPALEAAMTRFGVALEQEPADGPRLPVKRLGPLAMDVAKAARALTLRSWKADIPEVDEVQGR